MQETALTNGWRFSLNGGEEKEVTLPHDFSMEQDRSETAASGKDGGWYPGGMGEYTLALPPTDDEVASLFIDGCQGLTEVWLNDNRIAFHPSGYMPFTVELSPWLTDAENLLKIKVNNLALPSSRWYTGSGLYRSVTLLTAPRVHIPYKGVYAHTLSISENTALVRFEITVSGGSGDVSVEILSPDGQICAAEKRSHVSQMACFDISLPADRLWTDEHPWLWTCRAHVKSTAGKTDSCTQTFGIRTVKADPTLGLLINGRAVKLRGGCVHHDNGPLGACAYKDAERRKLTFLKDAGFNALRLAHNPPSTVLLDACDELGMYVIDEAFDCWRQGKVSFDYHIFFDDRWERDLTDLILRDRSHPSVIMWSHGNEIPERSGVSGGYEIARRLSQAIRSLDDRPITHALCSFWESKKLSQEQAETEHLPLDAWASYTAETAATTDIAGYNYMHGRIDKDRAQFPERIFALTETFPGEMLPSWKTVSERAYVVGDFTWTAWDYIGESGIGHVKYDTETTHGLMPYPWHLANCGDFDLCGVRRPQSYAREIVWGLRREPYIGVIAPGKAGRPSAVSMWGYPDADPNWTFPGREGQRVSVYVYCGDGACVLTLNGTVIGSETCNEKGYCLFDTVYEPGELSAYVTRENGEKACSSLKTVGTPVRIKTSHVWDGDELLFLDAAVCDEDGNVIYDSDALLKAEVRNAELLGFCGGNPESTEQYTAHEHHAWKGRAQLVVRKTPGMSVTIRSEGLIPLVYPENDTRNEA